MVDAGALYRLADDDAVTQRNALLTLIKGHFNDATDAAELLESWAADSEAKAHSLYAADRPYVVRKELDGSFSRNAERLVAHSSRELDRSLKRYWQLWEWIMQMGEPVCPGPPPDDPDKTGPPSEIHILPQTGTPDRSVDNPDKKEQRSPDNPASDLNAISNLLDRILESTITDQSKEQPTNPAGES